MQTSLIIKNLLVIAAITVPLAANAESNFQTGAASPLTATAHVDFQITIPKFLFLRVGTGTGTAAGGYATLATIDEVTWAPTAAQVGTGVLAGAGGDLTGGAETAVVVANNGNVTLSSTTTGALSDGAGDTISYAKIVTTASHNTTATTLAAPTLADGATTTTSVIAVGKIVQQDAKWTYTYANNTTPPAGIYGGVGINAGRVTYTASVP